MCHSHDEIVGATVGAIVNTMIAPTVALTVASRKHYMQPNVQLAHGAPTALAREPRARAPTCTRLGAWLSTPGPIIIGAAVAQSVACSVYTCLLYTSDAADE